MVRYNETQLIELIKETDEKEEEIRHYLGGIKILRPAALGAVGGATVGRPVEILLYRFCSHINLFFLFVY